MRRIRKIFIFFYLITVLVLTKKFKIIHTKPEFVILFLREYLFHLLAMSDKTKFEEAFY